MSALSTALEGVAISATEVGIQLLKRQISKEDAAKQLVETAVATGVELADLRDHLEAAGRARQDGLFEAAKRFEIGDPGDEG